MQKYESAIFYLNYIKLFLASNLVKNHNEPKNRNKHNAQHRYEFDEKNRTFFHRIFYKFI